jgi:hypothetical protein
MGNRGRLHDASGRIVRGWQGKAWITCTLREKPGRSSPGVMPSNGYTRLFFHDEAVACAAGHRPCAECRRAAYTDFVHAWAQAFGRRDGAAAINTALHDARIDAATRAQRQHSMPAEQVPPGAFIHWQGRPHLVRPDDLLPFLPDGYSAPVRKPDAAVMVLTPAPLVAVMRAGWQPALSAGEDRPNW